MNNEAPLFDALCKARLNKTIQVCEERGNQYGDTLKNCQWLVMRAVSERLDSWPLSMEAARKLAMAALVDIKYQRFEGGYKVDNLDDGINYAAVLAELMEHDG